MSPTTQVLHEAACAASVTAEQASLAEQRLSDLAVRDKADAADEVIE